MEEINNTVKNIRNYFLNSTKEIIENEELDYCDKLNYINMNIELLNNIDNLCDDEEITVNLNPMGNFTFEIENQEPTKKYLSELNEKELEKVYKEQNNKEMVKDYTLEEFIYNIKNDWDFLELVYINTKTNDDYTAYTDF